jgi:hypothetical protein
MLFVIRFSRLFIKGIDMAEAYQCFRFLLVNLRFKSPGFSQIESGDLDSVDWLLNLRRRP